MRFVILALVLAALATSCVRYRIEPQLDPAWQEPAITQPRQPVEPLPSPRDIDRAERNLSRGRFLEVELRTGNAATYQQPYDYHYGLRFGEFDLRGYEVMPIPPSLAGYVTSAVYPAIAHLASSRFRQDGWRVLPVELPKISSTSLPALRQTQGLATWQIAMKSNDQLRAMGLLPPEEDKQYAATAQPSPTRGKRSPVGDRAVITVSTLSLARDADARKLDYCQILDREWYQLFCFADKELRQRVFAGVATDIMVDMMRLDPKTGLYYTVASCQGRGVADVRTYLERNVKRVRTIQTATADLARLAAEHAWANLLCEGGLRSAK